MDFMSGTLLVVNHVCSFGIRREVQYTQLSFHLTLWSEKCNFSIGHLKG